MRATRRASRSTGWPRAASGSGASSPGVDGENVAINLEGETETALLPFDWLTEAKLVITDELLKRGADAEGRAAGTGNRSGAGGTQAHDPQRTKRKDHDHLTGISANRLELLQIADAVAREKSIEREIVIEAIEEAIQKAARTRYGAEHDIRVHMDPKTGETTITRVVTVVDEDFAPARRARARVEEGVANDYAQRRLSDALQDRQGRRGRQDLCRDPAALRIRPGADPDGPPGGHG